MGKRVAILRRCILVFQHYWQLYGNSGALAGFAFNGSFSPQQSGPFPDAGQSELTFFNVIQLEPDAAIMDLDAEPVAMLHQLNLDLLTPAVLAGIRQCFLGNAINRILHDGSQPLELDLAEEFDLGAFFAGSSFTR